MIFHKGTLFVRSTLRIVCNQSKLRHQTSPIAVHKQMLMYLVRDSISTAEMLAQNTQHSLQRFRSAPKQLIAFDTKCSTPSNRTFFTKLERLTLATRRSDRTQMHEIYSKFTSFELA